LIEIFGNLERKEKHKNHLTDVWGGTLFFKETKQPCMIPSWEKYASDKLRTLSTGF
jgi:hypothetical protein